MRSTSVIMMAYLLFAVIAGNLPQFQIKTINGQLEGNGILLSTRESMFYNFTHDHLFVEDEGDWVSEGIDVRRTYVACDGHYIYLLWVTPFTGSHAYEIYFDVGNENGYPIGALKATYFFRSWEQGFFKWNGTDWQSESGGIAQNVHSNQEEQQEYREFKIALSNLGSPSMVKLIHRILYDGYDHVPDDSFVLIHLNQSKRFVASFYAKTSVFGERLREIRKQSIGYYGEGFNMSLKLMNFGNSSLGILNVSLNLPIGLIASLNETSWNISLEPNKYWNLQSALTPERLGRFNLTAIISCNEAENVFAHTIPLNLLVIPNMNLAIQHSGQMEAGFPNDLNITISNHEEATDAKVSVVTYGQCKEYWHFNPLIIELGSNSFVRILTEVIPLAIINPEDTTHNYSFLEMALEFENIPIYSSGSSPFPSGPIVVTEPNVRITLQYPSEVVVGETFYVNISAVNNEDKEIMASFKVKASALSSVLAIEDSNYREQTALISPNFNITFSFKFKAMEEDPWDARVNFDLRHGSYGDNYYVNIRVISLFTKFWPIIQYTLITIFLAIVVGLAFLQWRKKRHEFDASRNQTTIQ